MKWIKYFVGLVFLISFFSISYSSEHTDSSDLWEKLRGKYPVFDMDVADGETPLTKEERCKRIDEGFLEIEKTISPRGLNLTLPKSLKEFYREVGNLGFGVYILSPIGGIRGQLYNGIRDRHEEGIPIEWFTFASIDSNEYFCINYQGKVACFTILPKVKKHDTYANISEWAKTIFLRS